MIQQLVKKDRPSVIRYQTELPDYLSILKNNFATEKVSALQRPLTLTNASSAR